MGIHAEDAAGRPHPRSCARCSPGALPPPPGPGRRSSSKEALREPTASCEAAKLEARRARDSLLRAATDTHEGTVNPAKADGRNACDRAEAHVEKVRIEAFAARDDAIAAAYPVHDAAEEAANAAAQSARRAAYQTMTTACDAADRGLASALEKA